MTTDMMTPAPAAPGELGRLKAGVEAAQAYHRANQTELARARRMISDAKRTIAGATLDSDFADVARARAQIDVAERWEAILKVRVGSAGERVDGARKALGLAEARVRQLQEYLDYMGGARTLELEDEHPLDSKRRRYLTISREDIDRELAALTQG